MAELTDPRSGLSDREFAEWLARDTFRAQLAADQADKRNLK